MRDLLTGCWIVAFFTLSRLGTSSLSKTMIPLMYGCTGTTTQHTANQCGAFSLRARLLTLTAGIHSLR